MPLRGVKVLFMRIVAGVYKSRVIETPSGSDTRPTTDRVREALFSAIWARMSSFDNAHVLDAFAGSGALGIEALSRGCSSCIFFEKDFRAQKAVRSNLAVLKIPASSAKLYKQDVLNFVDSAAQKSALANPFLHAFDLVLLDPPYALEPHLVRIFCENLAKIGALSSNALISYEHAVHNMKEVQEVFQGLSTFKIDGTKKYGKIAVTFLRYKV